MERFYHIRAKEAGFGKVRNNGGATVQIRSMGNDPLHLQVRVAYCNVSDVFCKKSGRDHCTGRPERTREVHHGSLTTPATLVIDPAIPPKDWDVITLRELPSVLGIVWRNVHRRAHIRVHRDMAPDFDHRIREWLPRE